MYRFAVFTGTRPHRTCRWIGWGWEEREQLQGLFFAFFFFIFGTAEWLVVPVCSPPPQAELGWHNGPAGPAGPSAITLQIKVPLPRVHQFTGLWRIQGDRRRGTLGAHFF